MIQRPQAIFFDWDGTLADSYSMLSQAHNYVRGIFEMPLLAENEFYQYFGQPREVVYQSLYQDRSEEAKIHFGDFIREHHARLLKPIGGAEGLLQKAHAMGIVLGVVSNKAPEFIHQEIAHFGWKSYFPVVIGAGQAQNDKPHAAPLILAIENAGLSGDRQTIWYVGDTENDMKCASGAGCVPFYVHPKHEEHTWLESYKPAFKGKDCNEITDFLAENSQNDEKEPCD